MADEAIVKVRIEGGGAGGGRGGGGSGDGGSGSGGGGWSRSVGGRAASRSAGGEATSIMGLSRLGGIALGAAGVVGGLAVGAFGRGVIKQGVGLLGASTAGTNESAAQGLYGSGFYRAQARQSLAQQVEQETALAVGMMGGDTSIARASYNAREPLALAQADGQAAIRKDLGAQIQASTISETGATANKLLTQIVGELTKLNHLASLFK